MKMTYIIYYYDAAWVGVHDLAEAHVRALEMDEEGRRLIVPCRNYSWRDWCVLQLEVWRNVLGN